MIYDEENKVLKDVDESPTLTYSSVSNVYVYMCVEGGGGMPDGGGLPFNVSPSYVPTQQCSSQVRTISCYNTYVKFRKTVVYDVDLKRLRLIRKEDVTVSRLTHTCGYEKLYRCRSDCVPITYYVFSARVTYRVVKLSNGKLVDTSKSIDLSPDCNSLKRVYVYDINGNCKCRPIPQ